MEPLKLAKPYKKPKMVKQTKHTELTIDMFTLRHVNFGRTNPFKYNFVFSRRGQWIYVNSFDDPSCDAVKIQATLIASKGERWRVIDAVTMEIVDESG